VIAPVLYHVADRTAREAIMREGLRPAREVHEEYAALHEWESAGDADYVWMTDAPRVSSAHFDAWRIDTDSLDIELGEQCDCPGESTGTWYIARHIPAAKLQLA
jgi:hypothetical protein